MGPAPGAEYCAQCLRCLERNLKTQTQKNLRRFDRRLFIDVFGVLKRRVRGLYKVRVRTGIDLLSHS